MAATTLFQVLQMAGQLLQVSFGDGGAGEGNRLGLAAVLDGIQFALSAVTGDDLRAEDPGAQ